MGFLKDNHHTFYEEKKLLDLRLPIYGSNGCHTGRQGVSRCHTRGNLINPSHAGKEAGKQGINSGFETKQVQTGVSVSPQKGQKRNLRLPHPSVDRLGFHQ